MLSSLFKSEWRHHQMWKLDKSRKEFEVFVEEIFIDNKERYSKITEWPHLWVDFWVSLFSMSYTLGHAVGLGIPLYLIIEGISHV